MSEPKFTPGTWSLNHESYGVHIEPSVAWIGFGTAHTETEHKANAALIAAAPEMYEQLKRHCAMCMMMHPDCEGCEICDTGKVLKKARGER